MSLAKGITSTATFSVLHASQVVCIFELWASAGHMHLRRIGSGAMFLAYILYVACHHLLQHHGGLGTCSRSEELPCWQLSLFSLLLAFACAYCMAGLRGASDGLICDLSVGH